MILKILSIMKTLKLIILLTILTITGCTKDNEKRAEDYPFYQHALWFGFQDTSGNDLVEEYVFELRDSETGEVINFTRKKFHTTEPEYYTLEYVNADGTIRKPLTHPTAILDVHYPRFALATGMIAAPVNDEYNYLWLNAHSLRSHDFVKKITLRFTCLSIFGDDKAHDIVTWWKWVPAETDPDYYYPVCSHVEVDGKKFPVKESIATIILDR